MEWKTRADFVSALEKLTEPLKPYYSEGGARLRLGPCGAVYNRDIIEMEAFARPLWGLVPFWAADREMNLHGFIATVCAMEQTPNIRNIGGKSNHTISVWWKWRPLGWDWRWRRKNCMTR